MELTNSPALPYCISQHFAPTHLDNYLSNLILDNNA